MVSLKFVERGIGLISTVALARLLAPSDFGLVAMALTIIALLELMGAFGFDTTLIQHPDAQRHHFDTAWTFNLAFGLAVAILLVALSHPAAQFYAEPRLVAVMYCMALGSVAGGLQNIGVVAFRRQLEFHREFGFQLGRRLASFFMTVALAFLLRSYWALVLGTLFAQVVNVLLSYYVHPYRPRLSLAGRHDLFHFSRWLLINNIIGFVNNKSADFIIGKLGGAVSLGLYSVACQISSLPTTELVAPINRAVFPGYSRLAGDLGELRSSFLNVISMIALFALPAGIGIALVADLLVPTILGSKWLAAIPLIQVLAIYGVIVALQTNIVYVYMAVGKPRLVTYIAGGQLVLLLVLLVPATSHYGALGAAWAFLGTVILMVPVNQMLIARRLNISLYEYAAKLWRPFVACVAMGLAIYVVKAMLSPEQQMAALVFALAACVAIGALVYTLALYGLWRMAARPDGAERFCLSRVEEALDRAGLRTRI
jgi:lipopolysaccharide exporter